jgi:hypothetical protein
MMNLMMALVPMICKVGRKLINLRFRFAYPFYTIEELKWDILILRWRGIGNDLK